MFPFEEKLLNTPLKDIIKKNNLFNELLPFDEYHLIMAQTDIFENIHEKPAVKLMFYRIPPFGGSYVVSAGLSAFLQKLDSFSYKQIVPYLKDKGYHEKFIKYAETRDKIIAKIYAVPENTLVFPDEPIVAIETNLIDARLIEGIILSEINFATLVATKWHRIKNASMGCPVMEFGRRRAQNPLKASLYSYMVGINSTSNCEANGIFGIPSAGTMGHEYIQSFPDEFTAFDKWLEHNPTKPCLLIDTINTLESGVVNSIKAFNKHKEHLISIGSWDKIGFRIDSGDLAYLASTSYNRMSKELGTEKVSVVLSNDLDEYSIESILAQLSFAGEHRVIDHLSFGLGTKGVTAWGEPALGGVCKISMIDDHYILKISNNNNKITIPGNLRSATVADKNGNYLTTLIYFSDEDISAIKKCYHLSDDSKFINIDDFCKITPKQSFVYNSNGTVSEFKGKYSNQSLAEICKNGKEVLDMLDWSYKRTTTPHRAKVSLSPKVFNVRWHMIRNGLVTYKVSE